ncbi:MAG: peptidoglycan-binding protein [Scytolyngbya sp. HA4215-MV1]|jgi:peptidoglycan hydrolase-like protein with peptidoglycan-binding domain|nr:peptidoglycan-binding protein [Scytolyngbya sp. HA4215-MV1]
MKKNMIPQLPRPDLQRVRLAMHKTIQINVLLPRLLIAFAVISLGLGNRIPSVLATTPKPKVPAPTGSMMNQPPAMQATTPILKFGSRGEAVKRLQNLLKTAGYYQERIDGVFGVQTQTAVSKFQHAKGLRADGIVGSKTWKALNG